MWPNPIELWDSDSQYWNLAFLPPLMNLCLDFSLWTLGSQVRFLLCDILANVERCQTSFSCPSWFPPLDHLLSLILMLRGTYILVKKDIPYKPKEHKQDSTMTIMRILAILLFLTWQACNLGGLGVRRKGGKESGCDAEHKACGRIRWLSINICLCFLP